MLEASNGSFQAPFKFNAFARHSGGESCVVGDKMPLMSPFVSISAHEFTSFLTLPAWKFYPNKEEPNRQHKYSKVLLVRKTKKQEKLCILVIKGLTEISDHLTIMTVDSKGFEMSNNTNGLTKP